MAGRIRLVGKEANRWEEQLRLGSDPVAQIDYGVVPEGAGPALATLGERCRHFPVRAVAAAAGLSVGGVSAIRRGTGRPTSRTLARVRVALARLEWEAEQSASDAADVIVGVRERATSVGLRRLAADVAVHPAVLSRVLAGKRKPSPAVLAKLRTVLAKQPVG